MSLSQDAAPYLIHTPPMRLVDSIIQMDLTVPSLSAELIVRADAPYWDAAAQRFKGPWHIELIAQATSILFNRYMAHDKPQMGFLLAVGDFRCHRHDIAVGDKLRVSTTNKLQLENFYVQRGEVHFRDHLVAEGDIKCLSDTTALLPPEDGPKQESQG